MLHRSWGLGGMRVKLPGKWEGETLRWPGQAASLCLPEGTNSEVLPVSLCNSDSADAPVPEHLSQCQNLTLYRSFCAMKYAIYALCVNSHQHTQCQECRDSPSEDPASAVGPVNDSVSSSGIVPTPLLSHKLVTTCSRKLFVWEPFTTRMGEVALGFIMPRKKFINLSTSVNQRDM